MSERYSFKTSGTCSSYVSFQIDGELVRSVSFSGGCSGNLLGIARLVEGMPASEVIARLEGLPCGSKAQSCPGELARALKTALAGTMA